MVCVNYGSIFTSHAHLVACISVAWGGPARSVYTCTSLQRVISLEAVKFLELFRPMSYYHGLISSRKANSVLDAKGDGSFLIRDSQSQPGSFVLSARFVTDCVCVRKERVVAIICPDRCRSGSRVYHVLIFHRGGQYCLDSAVGGGDGEPSPAFDSLDDLVVFLMAHDLRVEGTEVHFAEAVACADTQAHTSSR